MLNDNYLYNNRSWKQKWPITRDIMLKVINQDSWAGIKPKELTLILEFVTGFSKKILQAPIQAKLEEKQLKNIAIQLYYYNLFLIETQKCKTFEELIEYITLEKQFIVFAIHRLNPYITKSYFILLLNILSDYTNNDGNNEKSCSKELFLTAFRLFKEAVQEMIATLSSKKTSNYWVILLSMTSYVASYISLKHLEQPNRSEGVHFLDIAKATIKLVLPDDKNKSYEDYHNINYLILCTELRLNSIKELEDLILNFDSKINP